MSGVQSNQYYKAELHTQQRSDGVHMFCVPVRINFRAQSKITFYVSCLRGVHGPYFVSRYLLFIGDKENGPDQAVGDIFEDIWTMH